MSRHPPGVTLKHGRYYRVQCLADRKQKWHPLSREADGLPALYEALAKYEANPTPVLPPGIQIHINGWLSDTLHEASAAEQKEIKRMSDTIAHCFSQFQVIDITPKDIYAFVNEWVKEGKLRTAQRYMSVLKKFFTWAIIQGLRSDNPASVISTKAPAPNRRYITDAEYTAIRAKCLPMVQLFADLCYLTGQRSTDIRELQWSSINCQMIHFVPSKTEDSSGKSVDVPLTAPIIDVLIQLDEMRLGKHVIHTRTGTVYTAHGIGTLWERARIEAGVDAGATIKALRAKHATDAKKLGYSEQEIQVSLAHTDAGTTRTYLKERVTDTSVVSLKVPSA
jgi:integrase